MLTSRQSILSIRLVLLLLLIGVLSSCAGPAQLEPTQAPDGRIPSPSPVDQIDTNTSATDIPQVDPTTTPTTFQPPASHQDTQYELIAELNYDQHWVKVQEKIRYTNQSPDPLPDLLLMVEPATYPGTFQLETIQWENGQDVTGFTLDGNRMRIGLPQPLMPGEALSLSISYQLNLPSPVPSEATRPVPFGYTARQTNLVEWYPFIPPYIAGQGWLAHSPGYYGEHLAYEMSDFKVALRTTEPRPGLVVAASAPAQIDGEWRHYQHDDARNFALSASLYYQVITSTVGQTTVISYAFLADEVGGRAVMQTTSQALDLYSRLFGPYPRQQISVIEADFLDGMEYDGLYFLSKGFYNLYTGTPGEYLISIAAHETAHQWWYGMVGNDQALEPWLDEALCTYSERLYFESYYPQALKWWWDYRVSYYQPQGWIDISIYNPQGKAEAYLSYRDAVYLNGAKFIEELRLLIGDQAFFAFLPDYLSKNTGKIASADIFFTILQTHTQANLQPLISKYFSKQ